MCVPDRQSTSISESSFTVSSSSQDDESIKQFESSSTTNTATGSISTTLGGFGGGILAASSTLAFSLWFPFFLAPHAASQTYHSAFYHYESNDISKFDNSPWTYGTDYVLFGVMATLVYMCLHSDSVHASKSLRRRSAGLLSMYMISVLAGGYSHQNFTTLESRNTWTFRMLWTICVGTVTAAGGFMGLCGSEVARVSLVLAQHQRQDTKNHHHSGILLPVIPDSFWIAFGGLLTAFCAWGGISYQRPACDIFIAGTTQFPPTVYIMSVVALRNWNQHQNKDSPASTTETTTASTSPKTMTATKKQIVSLAYRVTCYIGFILNAPLLPMYPLLVQYTDWSLASVNTLLHSWLLVAWSMQGLSLRKFCMAFGSATKEHAA